MSLADDMAPEACIGVCVETIEESLKDALQNAPLPGEDSTAFVLMRGSAHKTLDEFDDSTVTITGPDGHEVQTTVGRFNEICEAVQEDPGLVDRVLGGDQ